MYVLGKAVCWLWKYSKSNSKHLIQSDWTVMQIDGKAGFFFCVLQIPTSIPHIHNHTFPQLYYFFRSIPDMYYIK